jgi:cold shock CspA family protein
VAATPDGRWDGPIPAAGPHDGSVTSFDQRRGLGSVTSSGGDEFPFHATAISDGSRAIEVGQAVRFTVQPGHGGRYESRSVTPLTS